MSNKEQLSLVLRYVVNDSLIYSLRRSNFFLLNVTLEITSCLQSFWFGSLQSSRPNV